MGLVHTPRVLATVAKSWLKRSSNPETRTRIGLVEPHKYHARAGLFDVDYLGHLNNAAYFYHAEYARWAMSTENGWIQAMMKSNSHFIVTAQSCRYRTEIRPVFRKFEVESVVVGIDDKNMWISQNFRHTQKGDDRVRAQVMVKGVVVQNRKVIDPRHFLIDQLGADKELVDAIHGINAPDAVAEIINCFEDLDNAKRKAASIIDQTNQV